MLKKEMYPIIKQVSYNNQIKNDKQLNTKKYKLQRKLKKNTDFFNIFQ